MAISVDKQYKFIRSIETDTAIVVVRDHPLMQLPPDALQKAAASNAALVFDAIASLPADFFADGRENAPPHEREAF